MPNSEKAAVNIQLNICYAFIAIGIVDMRSMRAIHIGMSAENFLFPFHLVAFWRLETLNFKYILNTERGNESRGSDEMTRSAN